LQEISRLFYTKSDLKNQISWQSLTQSRPSKKYLFFEKWPGHPGNTPKSERGLGVVFFT
jgi:hypothetical protein